MDDSRAFTTLGEIRALELATAGRIDDARLETAAAIAEATGQALRTVASASERGARQADARYEERVAAAVAEADRIRIDGQAAAADLLVTIRPHLLGLVDAMLDLVLETAAREGG
jgi:vacuolar-type H+-ATPase subunit H